LQKGILNGSDVLFFVTFALLWVGLTIIVLERKRLR
jgi:hypothetical protein